MATHGNRDQVEDAPKFTTNATTGESGQDEFGEAVYGVDPTEAQVAGSGVGPGWVRVVRGTGGRAGRVQYETLVAMKGIRNDAEDDDVFPDSDEPVIEE